ncbi:hypothetical protein [Halorussus pelagicus]|uniref:hypothetical protein n=1 Tax=Halorussus pelagicus TaxID=2505977 RepID=UPI000FFBFB8F|nr:hypothetical protein [Halorussus pelagicus]
MGRTFPDGREAAPAVVAALVVGLLGLAFASVWFEPIWRWGESVLGAVMAVLVVLLLLKVAVVFASIGLRVVLSLAE